MKNCEKLAQGSLKFCFGCEGFPCARLSHLDERYRTKYATSPIKNLTTIKAVGIRKFVASENQKWACPQCGSLLSMHIPQCRSCGYTWHR